MSSKNIPFSVEPLKIIPNLLPSHATIFTARLPKGVGGGTKSELVLSPLGNLFKRYKLHTRLEDSQLITEEVARSLREGDLCRFVINDGLLPTAHHVEQRNWATATPLRPVYTRSGIKLPSKFQYTNEDSREQVVLADNDAISVMESVCYGELALTAGQPQFTNPTLNNDFNWMSSVSKKGYLDNILSKGYGI